MLKKILEIFMHFDFSGARKGYFEVKKGGFFVKNRSKGRSGSESCYFFCKMRKCSKHCVLRVQIAVRRFQNRTKSVEEGQKLSKIRENTKKNACDKKNETERQKLGPRSDFTNSVDFRSKTLNSLKSVVRVGKSGVCENRVPL